MSTPSLTGSTQTDLNDLVDGLKRELAVPGTFATVFPSTSDDDLAGSLGNAFAAAQLDGFFGNQVLDVDTSVVTPGISAGGGALVLLYAVESVVRSQIRVLQTKTHYAAEGVVYEVEQSASALTQELKDIQQRRQAMLALILRLARQGQTVYTSDAYLIRSQGYFSGWGLGGASGLGFYGWELPGFAGFSEFL